MPLPCTRSIFSSSVISFSTRSARSSGERLVFIHGPYCFCPSSWACAWNRANFGATIPPTASIAAITRVQRQGLFIFCNHPVKSNFTPVIISVSRPPCIDNDDAGEHPVRGFSFQRHEDGYPERLRVPNDLFSRHSPVNREPSRSGQLFQQSLAFAEPRSLASLHVPRQGPLLRQQFLRPLAGLFPPVRRLQKTRVVVKRFRSRRNLRHFGKKLVRAFQLSGSRVSVRQQAPGPVIVEFSVRRNHALQVRNRRRQIVQSQRTLRS